MMYNFSPASPDEQIVFGSQRPGYPSRQVSTQQTPLLKLYEEKFGASNLCHAPVPDYHLTDKSTLRKVILPFLYTSDEIKEKVLVHCSGGTGHVLAAWLVQGRDFGVKNALNTSRQMGRNPLEAIDLGYATTAELWSLLRGL